MNIGDKIKHGPAYPMTCSERFLNIYGDDLQLIGRMSEPQPLFLSGESFVIGLKRAIMSEYKYTPSQTFQGLEDAYPEVEPAYASGKMEECVVCIKSIKQFKPYLVRKKDIYAQEI